MSKRKLTNDDLLLQEDLVIYFDPIDGVNKQVTIEAAKRIAQVNSDMMNKLIALEVLNPDGTDPDNAKE